MKTKNFRYLSNMIKTSQNIILDADISLEDGEEKHFDSGIYIIRDDITINGNGHVIDSKNRARVFYNIRNMTIRNLIFRNGNTTQKEGRYSEMRYGGVIYNLGKITLENCKFESNTSKSFGGAITNQDGAILKISNCKFKDNDSHEAGAIFNKSLLEIDNSLFKNNSSIGYGGAITNEGILRIRNSAFIENECGDSGGAINNFRGILESDNCQFRENSSAYLGGAVNNFNGDIKLKNIKFIKNRSINSENNHIGNIKFRENKNQLINCEFTPYV